MGHKIRLGCLLGLLILASLEIRTMSHGKAIPLREKFDSFPASIGDWTGSDLPDLPKAEKKVLAVDDYLMRDYQRRGVRMDLFIAYYEQQRSGDALHSPKNCLPGSGWQPVESKVVDVPDSIADGAVFEANYYVVEKDGTQEEVLYWYQTGARRFASEYLGKAFLVWDGITRNRTDGALVRITSSPTSGGDRKLPEMIDFAKEMAPLLPEFLPN